MIFNLECKSLLLHLCPKEANLIQKQASELQICKLLNSKSGMQKLAFAPMPKGSKPDPEASF